MFKSHYWKLKQEVLKMLVADVDKFKSHYWKLKLIKDKHLLIHPSLNPTIGSWTFQAAKQRPPNLFLNPTIGSWNYDDNYDKQNLDVFKSHYWSWNTGIYPNLLKSS